MEVISKTPGYDPAEGELMRSRGHNQPGRDLIDLPDG